MVSMYNPRTKTWVDVPDEDVDSKYKQGFMFEKGARLDVFFPGTKKVTSVGAAEYHRALMSGGKFYTGGMRQSDERYERLSGWEGKALAASAGALGGATIDPVGDALLAKMSDYTPEDIATARELHPWTAGGAGVLGFGASVAATGGIGALLGKGAVKVGLKQSTTNLLGKTATVLVPPVAATKLAGKVTSGVAGGLSIGGRQLIKPLATTAGRDAVSKTQLAKMAGAVGIGEAAGAALEGVYYGVGRTVAAPMINEESIGTPDEIAEAIIHDTAVFGVLGGAMGAGFTVMGKAAAPAMDFASKKVKAPLGSYWADKLDKMTVALGTIETPDEVFRFLKKTREDPEWVDRAIQSEQHMREVADNVAVVVEGFNDALHSAAKIHTGPTKDAAMYAKTRGIDPKQPLKEGEDAASVVEQQLLAAMDVSESLHEMHRLIYTQTTRTKEHRPLLIQTSSALDEMFPEFLRRAENAGVLFRYVATENGPRVQFSSPATKKRGRRSEWRDIDISSAPGQTAPIPLTMPGLPENFALPRNKKDRDAAIESAVDEVMARRVEDDSLRREYARSDEYMAHVADVDAFGETEREIVAALNEWRVKNRASAKYNEGRYAKEFKEIQKERTRLQNKIKLIAKNSKEVQELLPKQFFQDMDKVKVRRYYSESHKAEVIRLENGSYGAIDLTNMGPEDILGDQFYKGLKDLDSREVMLGGKPGAYPKWMDQEVTGIDFVHKTVSIRGPKGEPTGGIIFLGPKGETGTGRFTNLEEMAKSTPSLRKIRDHKKKKEALEKRAGELDTKAEEYVGKRRGELQKDPAARQRLRDRFQTNSRMKAGDLAEEIIARSPNRVIHRRVIQAVLSDSGVRRIINSRPELAPPRGALGDMGAYAYRQMDTLKKLVDRSGEFTRELPMPKNFTLGRYAGKLIGGVNHHIRDFLMDTDLWGGAAVAQREVNEAFTAASRSREDLMDSFADFVTEKTRPDPKQIRDYLEDVADDSWGRKTLPGQEAAPGETSHIATERMRAMVAATEMLTNSIKKHYKDDEFNAKADAILSAVSVVDEKLPRLVEDLNAGRALKELRATSAVPMLGLGAGLSMTGMTWAAPFLVQIAAPAQVVQTRARIQAYLTKRAEAMQAGAAEAARVVRSGEFKNNFQAVRKISAGMVRRSLVNAEIVLQEKQEDREESKGASKAVKDAQAIAGAVSSIAADPARLSDALAKGSYPLDGAPKAQDNLSGKVSNVINYLNTQYPTGMVKTMDLGTGRQKFLTTEVAANQYLDTVFALSSPIEYLSTAYPNAMLTVPGIKAIETVFPDLIAEYRLGLRAEMAGMKISPDIAMQTSLLLGAPSTPMYDGQIMRILQGVYVERETGGTPGKGKRKLRLNTEDRLSATGRIAV